MDVTPVELTEPEIRNLCANVTPKIREFCAAHMNWPDWPERWLSMNVTKDPGENLESAPPYTVEQWWEFINDRVVNPGEPSSSAAQ